MSKDYARRPIEITDNNDFDRQRKHLVSVKRRGLARIFGIEQYDQDYYLVVKRISGETLESIINEGNSAQDEQRVNSWMQQLFDLFALLHTYQPQMCCCEMEPSDIIIDSMDQIWLTYYRLCRNNNDKIKDIHNLRRLWNILAKGTEIELRSNMQENYVMPNESGYSLYNLINRIRDLVHIFGTLKFVFPEYIPPECLAQAQRIWELVIEEVSGDIAKTCNIDYYDIEIHFKFSKGGYIEGDSFIICNFLI